MHKPDEDAVFWTYEYYVDSKGKIHQNQSGINGRKFYWHHPFFSMEKCKAEPDKLNKTIRPLNGGISFRGKIYFQNLSELELNTLCLLINAGDDEVIEKKRHGYKLGAAKPLGLGSVALHVDQVILRSYGMDREGLIQYEEKSYEPNPTLTLADEEVLMNYSKTTSFDYLKGKNVDYPRIKEDGPIFEWFSKNHTGYFINRSGQKIYNNMPQSRNNMLYEEYLKAMVPVVQRVYLKKQEETEPDKDVLVGTVVGYNPKNTTAYVEVPGRKKTISIFFKNVDQKTVGRAEYGKIHLLLTEGTRVQVIYVGRDNNGYDKWVCNKIISKAPFA